MVVEARFLEEVARYTRECEKQVSVTGPAPGGYAIADPSPEQEMAGAGTSNVIDEFLYKLEKEEGDQPQPEEVSRPATAPATAQLARLVGGLQSELGEANPNPAPAPPARQVVGVRGAERLAEQVEELRAKMATVLRENRKLKETIEVKDQKIRKLLDDIERIRKDPNVMHPSILRLRKMGLNTPALAELGDRWAGYVLGRTSMAMEVGSFSFRNVFAAHATNGVLTEESFKTVLRQFEPSIKSDQLTRLWYFADEDGSGRIDLFEFMRMAGVNSNGEMTDEYYEVVTMHLYRKFHARGGVRRVYATADKNWDQHLNLAEFHKLVQVLLKDAQLTKREISQVFQRMNVSGSGMLSVYELEAALEAAGAKCHVSEAWVKETFHQLATLIQDAGLNIKSVFPPGLVVEKEFRDVALRFLTQLRPSQLDRLWKYLQATCADDAVQVRHAGGDRDRLPSDSVVAVVFGPTLTSSPNELSSPGLQGAGAAGYYGPAGGVGREVLEQLVQQLVRRAGDVSPDVCFDTLSPFITAEHFQEMLSTRLGLHYDPVKAKQVFKLCSRRGLLLYSRLNRDTSSKCCNCGASGAAFLCSRCHNVRFCSPSCQRKAWKGHREHCAEKGLDEWVIVLHTDALPGNDAGTVTAGAEVAKKACRDNDFGGMVAWSRVFFLRREPVAKLVAAAHHAQGTHLWLPVCSLLEMDKATPKPLPTALPEVVVEGAKPVEKFASLSVADMDENFHNSTPVVLTDAQDSWPARRKWTFEWLAEQYGDEVMPCSDLAPFFRHCDRGNIRTVQAPLREFVRYVQGRPNIFGPLQAPDRVFYANGWTPFLDHKELLSDVSDRLYCVSDSIPAGDGPAKVFNASLTKIFMGPAGTVSRLHHDTYATHVWLSQIRGRKQFICYPPGETHLLHSLPVDEVDGRTSLFDPSNPDYTRFPDARRAQAYSVVVEEGETVVLPARWWHWAKSLTPSITLMRNFVNHANIEDHVEIRKRAEKARCGIVRALTPGKRFRLMFKALAPDSHALTTRESLEDDLEKEEQHQVQRLQNRVLLLQREVQELRGPSDRGHLEPTVPEKQFQQLSQAHGKVANHLQALRAQLQAVGAKGVSDHTYSHVLQHHLTAHWTSQKMEVEYRTRYLPFEIRGAGVLVKEDERHFRIDNSKLGESAQGVCYRLSKDASDKDFEHVAFWNSIVAGKDTGDGWLLCDLDSENLELLDQLDRETPLETLSSKFFKSSMVCCSTSSNIDGRWISSVFPGQKTIRGALVNDGAVTRPLTWDGLNAFSVIVAGEKRRARLVEDRLLWHDGELWTRDHRDMDVVKPTEKLGKDLETTNAKFQCVCQKGLKPGSSNQDAWSLLRVENEFTLYTICDGHGPHGHDVANFVKNNLPRVLIKDPRFSGIGSFSCMGPVFLDAFRLCHMLIDTADSCGKLDALWSGTTATTVLHNHQTGQLLLAHAGDSSAVVGSESGKEVRARQLTRDHKPSLCDERDRIVAWGGRIEFDGFADYRVYDKDGYGAGLNMTRSLGDLNAHCDSGLIADPELGEYMAAKLQVAASSPTCLAACSSKLCAQVTAEDQVLLLCSDGIWEFVSPQDRGMRVSAVSWPVLTSHELQEAVELVLKQSDAAAARALVDEARRRWLERAAWSDGLPSWSRGCRGQVPEFTTEECRSQAEDFLVWIWETHMRQRMCEAAELEQKLKAETESFQSQLQALTNSNALLRRRLRLLDETARKRGVSLTSDEEPDSDEAQTPAKKPEVLLCEQLLVSERKAVEDLPVPTVEELYGHVQLILAKLQKALLRNPAMKKGHVQELLKKSGDVVIDGRWKVKSILSYSKRMVVALCQDLHVGSEVIVKMSQTLEASLQLAHVDYVLRMLSNVPIVPQVQYCSSPSSSLPFLVMELLQGSTLDVRFQETEAMLELEAAEIGHALLMGMDACHQRQVFNLALCPENVWVGPPLEGSRVRILDWSISETGAAVVENPKLYAYINMRKTGLLRGKNGPTLMSGGQEVSPSEIAAKRDRRGLLQKLVFNGHGSLYYMSMEQLYQTIRSFGRAGSPATISQSWFQESIGSVVKVEGRTVHWFQKGDGFVQTNQPVTVTPLGQLFEVEVIKAVNLGRKLDCELGFCIGLCSKPPRASEKAKTERQDCWIAGGDTSFYLKGVQRRVGKSSADGQQKYLHIGSDLHAKDRVAILAEWSGALSLFVNGEQVGRYSNAIDHSEVVLPLYGVADIFVREASEDYTVRSIGLIGDESEDGWTVQKEQMERAAVELAGIYQLLHGEAAVATTIGPSCDLYACGRILLSLFRGGREVLPSSNLDRFAVAYANWAQAGCPPTEKRYGLLWALKELKGEKTERSEELAQLEKSEVRLVVSRCIKRSRYSRLGSCWEAAEMLASASSWLSMSDDFMKSHLDAVQQAKRSSLLDTHYSLAQELYEQERKLSGESLLNRATHTAMQAAQHRAEGRSVSARWNLRPYIIGPAHIQRILQVIQDWPQGRSIQAVAISRFQPTLDEELQESLLSCFSQDLQPQHETQTQSAKPKRRRMLRHSVCNVHLGDATQPSLFLEDVRLPSEELPRSVFPLEEILSRNLLWLVAQMVRKLDLTPAPPGLGQEKPPSVGGMPGAVETLVAGMARSTILVSLSLRSSCLRDQGVFQLAAAVAKCQTLRELDLSDNNFGAKGAAKVLQSGKEHLEMLDLSRNRLGDAGAKALSEVLLNCHSISVLRLRANGIGDEGGEALAESLMSVTSLREFDFSQNEIHLPTSSVMLRAVCASRGLQRLYLDSSLPWPTSDSFEVQVAGFTDQLSGAQAVPSLQFLSLRRCGLSTSACKLFQSLASNSTLRQLNVSCNGLRQSVAPAIAAALTSASTGLEELDLRDNRLGAQDALAVALEQVYAAAAQAGAMRRTASPIDSEAEPPNRGWNNCLRQLNLANNEITATAVSRIAPVLPFFNALEELLLYHNPMLGDAGAQALAEALNPDSWPLAGRGLKTLSLAACSIGDAGCQALMAAARDYQVLTSLDLSCNSITDDSAPAVSLVLAQPTSALESLSLSMNLLSSFGISQLMDGVASNIDGALCQIDVSTQDGGQGKTSFVATDALSPRSSSKVKSKFQGEGLRQLLYSHRADLELQNAARCGISYQVPSPATWFYSITTSLMHE
ncbi:PPC6-7 [Symbiodinium sp. CCMP2456]|nr:PPC6-7 [Symbiodinium sp. CCMP2456]